jgi:SsrA-binding protein
MISHFPAFSHYNRGMDSIAENRRAGFDYEISEKYTAGIELRGHEVKSVKSGQFQIAGARVLIRNGEAYLVNSHVPPYQQKNAPADYEEDRARRLLLTKSEIDELTGALRDKSKILIPLQAFLKNGFIKIELGLGRLRKKSDKREVIKKREHQREMRGEDM